LTGGLPFTDCTGTSAPGFPSGTITMNNCVSTNAGTFGFNGNYWPVGTNAEVVFNNCSVVNPWQKTAAQYRASGGHWFGQPVTAACSCEAGGSGAVTGNMNFGNMSVSCNTGNMQYYCLIANGTNGATAFSNIHFPSTGTLSGRTAGANCFNGFTNTESATINIP